MDSIESLVSQGMSGPTLLPAGGRQSPQGHGGMSEFLVGLAVLTPSYLHGQLHVLWLFQWSRGLNLGLCTCYASALPPSCIPV